MKRILVFGTFDLLHPGHISFLKQAKKKGSWLIAAVARDEFVRWKKKREPYHHEGERITQLLATGLVDEAYLSDEETGNYSVIRRCKPDVVCFGHDQYDLQEHLQAWLTDNTEKLGFNIELSTLKAHHPERYKSSKIIPLRKAGR